MILGAVTHWPSLLNTRGRAVEVKWDELFRRFSVWKPFAGQEAHPGWSAARFDPCERSEQNVRSLSALALDYDVGTPVETAIAQWQGRYGFLHTTRSHTPAHHRFRVVLPFGRPVSPFEYAGIWRRVFHRLEGKVDPAPKDPSRFWFTPGSPDRETFRAQVLDGQIVDPDELLAWPEPQQAPIPRPDVIGEVERRASQYLARMPEAIAGQEGHQALWAAALAMVQGFALNEQQAFTLLWNEYNPRCLPPWRDKDLWHKVRDASRVSRVPTGYNLDEERDWRPAAVHRPEVSTDAEAPAQPTPVAVDAVQHYGVESVHDLIARVYRQIGAEKKIGAPSGCIALDRAIGGFRRGNVTVFGAGTSFGKSTFAVMVTDVALKRGYRVLMVSSEDPKVLYGQRLTARRTRVRFDALRDGLVSDEERVRIGYVADAAEREPYFFDAIGKTAEYTAAAIRAVAKQCDPDLIIVDYLQSFGTQKKCNDRRGEVTHAARVLVDAIKGSNAAGLVFSQLRRTEGNKRPTMHDLKESGDVENMAEHVILGHNTRRASTPDEEIRLLFIDKNKDGGRIVTGIELTFDKATASFQETR